MNAKLRQKKFLITFLGIILLSLFSCKQEVTKEKAKNLTVSEGFKNPIGFYNQKPTFSWQLPVSEEIKSQSAYQIVVASSKDLLPNNADLWDSKKQETAQSTFIKYQGAQLQSRQKVFWQVRYWNQDKNASSWSDVNHFELGLLKNSDWKAKWTGLDTAKDSIKGVRKFLMHRPQYLRKGFELLDDVEKARLYITSKGVFDVHLNGKDISDDILTPGWTPYNHRIETLTYDVTDLLTSGKNAIAPIPNQPLTSAEASVNTPYGKASSSWKIENDVFYLDATIPPNTTAEIHFPEILKSKKPEIKTVSAGTYQFQIKLESNE